jgi:DNA polymerase I-like protein with 3'-5' exonuclease and polymerase domains
LAPLDGVPKTSSAVFLDTETTGLDPRVDRLVCAGFAADDDEPVALRHPEQREAIQRWLELDAAYVAHNANFDFAFLEHAGYTLPPPARWHDTVLEAHIAGERLPGRVRLRSLATTLIEAGELPSGALEPEDKLKAWLRHERRAARKESRSRPEIGDAPAHLLEPYLKADVAAARAVHQHYGAALDGQGPVLELEHRVLPAIYAAQRRGVPLDLDAARELRDRCEVVVGDLRARLFELADHPFNPNAAQQIETVLQERGVDLSAVPRTPKADTPQFTADVLGTLDDELARALLDYRAEKKLADYVRGLWRHAHGDRLYGSFRQVGAATGRMSSGSPNLQNIPQSDLRVRYCICAGAGRRLVGADLDSIELRLLAAYAPGGALARALRDGGDLHAQTAEALGVERDQGKRINYAITYGAGGRRIAQILGCDPDEGWAALERWYHAYPEVKRLKRGLEKQVRRRGYIRTAGGRHHAFEEPNHMMLNYLIQGSAADLFKRSVAELHEAGVSIVLLVHDEVVCEVDEEHVDETAQLLEQALTREVSLPGVRIHDLAAKASVHQRWSDFKEEGWSPS